MEYIKSLGDEKPIYRLLEGGRRYWQGLGKKALVKLAIGFSWGAGVQAWVVDYWRGSMFMGTAIS